MSLKRNCQYTRKPKDQLMALGEDGCEEDEGDIYQQLAEKEHYLMIAAEAGKVLLETNQELANHFQSLQEEYVQKIECLEQDRHHLKQEINQRGSNYESRMQDLQQEISSFGGQLQVVQKTSRALENSQKSTYNDLAGQNKSLLSELQKVKSYNLELTRQVVSLISRIDDKGSSGETVDVNCPLTTQPGVSETIEYADVKNLKEEVRQLTESLHGISLAQPSTSGLQADPCGTCSNLQCDVSNLRQQMIMCGEELQKTKRNNEHLKDQLEEYMLIQATQSERGLSASLSEPESSIPEVDMNFRCMSNLMKYDDANVEEVVSIIHLSHVNNCSTTHFEESSQPGGQLSTSLFNELESSSPEVDMNCRCMNTSTKYEEDVGAGISNTRFCNDDNHSGMHDEKLQHDMQTVYCKLKALKNKLCGNEADIEIELHLVNGEIVTKLIDEIIDVINDSTVVLESTSSDEQYSPRDSLSEIDVDRSDNYSQPDSQMSDQDSDILEQQLNDFNQRLNITISEMEEVKKDLATAQTSAKDSEHKVHELTTQTTCKEREVENLRRENLILLSEKTMEEKLRKALEDRDEALKRESEIKEKYEEAKKDLGKLHDQLIAAVQQKLKLSEQLEQWQFDMTALIDKQLTSKLKLDNQRSRKRCSCNPPKKTTRSLAAKFFAYRSTKETPPPPTA